MKFDWRRKDDENTEVEGIVELKDNKFPKGLVPWKKIFDKHDMYK